MSDGWRELSDSELGEAEEPEEPEESNEPKLPKNSAPKIEKAEDLKAMLETSFEKSGNPEQKNLINLAFSLIEPKEDKMIVAGWNEVLNMVNSGETTKDPRASAIKLLKVMMGAKTN